MDPLRVVIADDHPVFRFGLRALVGAQPDMTVVGEATTGEEVVALATQLQPDVVLMDLHMPGLGGIEATRRLAHAEPQIGVLIITMFDDDSVFAAIRAGARGYLLKGSEGEEAVAAIRTVGRGEAIFSPTIAGRVIRYFAAPGPATRPTAFPELSDRERGVLALLAQGYTNSAIAERLALSPKTVRNHVSLIFGKLHVADRAAAIGRARDAGLGQDTP